MKRIKFYCEEKRGFTLFQVLEQWGIERGYFSYQASNGVQIFSEVQVALEPKAIYLRGKLIEYDTYLVISNKITKDEILKAFKDLAGCREGKKVTIDRWQGKNVIIESQISIQPLYSSFQELDNNEYLVEWED